MLAQEEECSRGQATRLRQLVDARACEASTLAASRACEASTLAASRAPQVDEC
jgi:hypothetical protein